MLCACQPGNARLQLVSSSRKCLAVIRLSSYSRRKLHVALRLEELLRTLPSVPPCPPAFISGVLRLLSRSALQYLGKCCLVSCFELGMGAWVFFGWWRRFHVISVRGPFALQAPFGVVFGWLPLAELPWMPVCPAQGSRLVPRLRITAHFDRHHLQAHLLAMCLNVAKCNLG